MLFGFILGLFIGVTFGVILMGWLIAAGRADEHLGE